MLSEDDMDILGKNMGDTLYFVDGYHGGVEGHMPDGAFEDILDALERLPEWKVSFEVEPESWNDLKRKDPTGYRRLKAFIKNEKTAGRIEFVSGAYGQPFCWAINGESNIRHLRRGIEEIRKHFPNVVIDTYAVQEPCFSSCMPQICKKLGYERMSLKNPTSWAGICRKCPERSSGWNPTTVLHCPVCRAMNAKNWSAAARPRRLAMIFDLSTVLRKNV